MSGAALRRSTWCIAAVATIGLGLATAPAVFQMFHRAPLGGEMIDDFHPFMTGEQVALFRGYVADIDAANTESLRVRGALTSAGLTPSYDQDYVSVNRFNEEWPAIDADMTDLLGRMERNLDNFDAVAALPPFSLFPWFFVVPGVLLAGLAASTWWPSRRADTARKRTISLLCVGVGVLLAPLAFQMFSRAPKGRDMIDDFRPMMTAERVQRVQLAFVTLGAAEGQLRTKVLPLAAESGVATDVAALQHWSDEWPSIVRDFNPMIATMADDLDNYAAVDALPPFHLFPWFFAVPGALVVGLSIGALRRGGSSTAPRATSEVPGSS